MAGAGIALAVKAEAATTVGRAALPIAATVAGAARHAVEAVIIAAHRCPMVEMRVPARGVKQRLRIAAVADRPVVTAAKVKVVVVDRFAAAVVDRAMAAVDKTTADTTRRTHVTQSP